MLRRHANLWTSRTAGKRLFSIYLLVAWRFMWQRWFWSLSTNSQAMLMSPLVTWNKNEISLMVEGSNSGMLARVYPSRRKVRLDRFEKDVLFMRLTAWRVWWSYKEFGLWWVREKIISFTHLYSKLIKCPPSNTWFAPGSAVMCPEAFVPSREALLSFLGNSSDRVTST